MDRTPSARLHALADEMWDTTLAVSPTIGTFLGLPGARHDRMDDNSFETVRRLQDLEFHQHILEDGTVPLRCWARRSTVGWRRHDRSAAPLYPSPPRRAIFSPMPDAADLTDQLADEDRAKQRRYVLANTRARWRFVALGAVLLAILRVAKVAPVSWPFVLGFAGVFAAVSYAMLPMARGGEFRGWRSEEHTSELQSRLHLLCRLLL